MQSKSYIADILNLTSKLREKGFNKHADELEYKFLILKKSEAQLYSVFKETGDSLLDEAHPDGSVNMSDAKDEGGVIETLVDQKQKIEKIVNKKPTGKLSNKNIVGLITKLSQTSIPELISEAPKAAIPVAEEGLFLRGLSKIESIINGFKGATGKLGAYIARIEQVAPSVFKAGKWGGGITAFLAMAAFAIGKIYKEFNLDKELANVNEMIKEINDKASDLDPQSKKETIAAILAFKTIIDKFSAQCQSLSLLSNETFDPNNPDLIHGARSIVDMKKELASAIAKLSSAANLIDKSVLGKIPFTDTYEVGKILLGLAAIGAELQQVINIAEVTPIVPTDNEKKQAEQDMLLLKELTKLINEKTESLSKTEKPQDSDFTKIKKDMPKISEWANDLLKSTDLKILEPKSREYVNKIINILKSLQ